MEGRRSWLARTMNPVRLMRFRCPAVTNGAFVTIDTSRTMGTVPVSARIGGTTATGQLRGRCAVRGHDAGLRAGVSELVRSMAQAARLAPSIHNSQPWKFSALPDGLAIHEDTTRSLPVVDPVGRLRAISCGAAVTNAALAVSMTGLRPVVDVRPSVDAPTLIATVVGTDLGRPDGAVPPQDRRRYDAIPLRRAHRRLHDRSALRADEVDRLRAAVLGEGARPVVPGATQRRQLGSVLREAVRHQLGDPAFVSEVGSWIRHPSDAGVADDGIPVASLGTAPYPADSLVHGDWDEDVVEDLPVEDELEASTIVGIATPGDLRGDWVIAGMALERLWLEATALDLAVTFADQATQWTASRDQAAEAVQAMGALQVVLRVGRPLVDVPATPRRPLDELWM
jgi:hypothetical protein